MSRSLAALSESVASLRGDVEQQQSTTKQALSELQSRVAGFTQQLEDQTSELRSHTEEILSSGAQQVIEAQSALRDELKSQRLALYLGQNTALTRTQLGHKIFLDTRDTAICPHILMDGMWEHWITAFVQERLEAGMVFVDVGANVGWYTLLGCARVGESGKVIAVEPQSRLASLVRSSLEVNGFKERAVVYEVALSDQPGQATLYQRANDNGSASLINWDPEFTVETSVEVTTLDALLGESRVDFVKLDAEKLEAKILKGASRLIAFNPDIQLLVEHHPGDQDAIADLCKGGFALHVIDYSGRARSITLEEVPGLPETAMLYLKRD